MALATEIRYNKTHIATTYKNNSAGTLMRECRHTVDFDQDDGITPRSWELLPYPRSSRAEP